MKYLQIIAIVTFGALSIGLASCNKASSPGRAAGLRDEAVQGEHGEQQTVTLAVQGMHCSSCPSIITDSLEKLPGVASCTTSLEQGSALVSFDPALISEQRIVQEIVSLGYSVGDAPAEQQDAEQDSQTTDSGATTGNDQTPESIG